MSLLGSVARALALLPEGAKLLAAVSGGADSTAMLAACAAVRGRAFCEGGGIRAIHVDHGLRPVEECAGDAEAVRSLCGGLGIACTVTAVGRGRIADWARAKGSGIEAAARHFRHEALRREAERVGADVMLIAHTQDDALETALMRVLRGSGPRGLALMPQFAAANPTGLCSTQSVEPGCPTGHLRGAVPPPCCGNAKTRPAPRVACNPVVPVSREATGVPLLQILRPLRDVTRAEVLDFLAERGLSYRTDSTNADIRYLRNRIRLRLVPVLDENFPEWRKGLLETAETQGLVADFIDAELQKRLRSRKNEEDSSEVIENLDELPEILREEALFAAIDGQKGDERTVRRRVVRDFARDSRVKAADVGGGIRVHRGGLPVRVGRDEAFYEKGFSLLIKEPGAYRMNGLRIEAAQVDGGLVVHIKGTQHGE